MHAALARPRPRRPSRRAPSWPVRAPVSQTDRPAPGFSRERAETARRARAPRRRTPATSARQQPELSERRIAYPGWVSGNPPSPLLFHPVSRLALPRRGAGLFPQWHFAKEPCGFSGRAPCPTGPTARLAGAAQQLLAAGNAEALRGRSNAAAACGQRGAGQVSVAFGTAALVCRAACAVDRVEETKA